MVEEIGLDQAREIRIRYSEAQVAVWRENVEELVRFARQRPAVIRKYVFDSLRTSDAKEEEPGGIGRHAP